IETALAVVARNASPLVLQVQGLGCFPNLQRPRVVWVGLEERTGRLALTHQAVNEALAQVGFEPETRPFKPHLTLGRVQRGASRDVAAQLGQAVARRAERGLTLGEETVTDLVLFRSVLKPTGAEYSRLATFTLGQ
ncbi:MAG TPA: RNA 2',3'-cyclic phosphodiesterase, partial [Chloroflexi bacterium]|nr:RNA 2',3'-cyclic phosphodiesterase [Chloroflexota bacterium]